MDYVFCLILLLMVVGVVVLGVTPVSYYGVVALMWVAFFCCVLMVFMGRVFTALVTYIVYLGGLVVVFGYCVSLEKDVDVVFKIVSLKFALFILVGLVVCFWALKTGAGGLLVSFDQGSYVNLEVNGYGVFYCSGGVGLMVCLWGLMITLFSVLIILGWCRKGGFRTF
uniref:NADH-ubiquinone oxidoreductase chain 6 n=1 Tax=Achalinus meiguensis TaxID=572522 RepID=B6ZC09_ACHME|nr:NADH dehydrogenase subunit 6 [Achalinus meiguensis]ACJ14787.1 NADH dehydrogenase subunit 6 [Achalinus meiguensis]